MRKSFTVHWIPLKCRENFCGACFICTENAEESHCSKDSLGKLSCFVEDLQKPQNFLLLNFCCLGYLLSHQFFTYDIILHNNYVNSNCNMDSEQKVPVKHIYKINDIAMNLDVGKQTDVLLLRLVCVYYAGIICSIIETGKPKALCQHNRLKF